MVFIRLAIVTSALVAALVGVSLIYASPGVSAYALAIGSPSSPAEGTLFSTANLTDTQPLTGSIKIAEAIADFFSTHAFSGTTPLSVTVDAVLDLKADGLGYGEIVKALFFASVSGSEVEDIVALKEDGMGWGQIKKTVEGAITGMGPNLGSIVSKAAKANKNTATDDEEATESSEANDATLKTRGKGGSSEHGNAGAGVQNKSGGRGGAKGNSANAPGRQK